jgi:hypothetical protein
VRSQELVIGSEYAAKVRDASPTGEPSVARVSLRSCRGRGRNLVQVVEPPHGATDPRWATGARFELVSARLLCEWSVWESRPAGTGRND